MKSGKRSSQKSRLSSASASTQGSETQNGLGVSVALAETISSRVQKTHGVSPAALLNGGALAASTDGAKMAVLAPLVSPNGKEQSADASPFAGLGVDVPDDGDDVGVELALQRDLRGRDAGDSSSLMMTSEEIHHNAETNRHEPRANSSSTDLFASINTEDGTESTVDLTADPTTRRKTKRSSRNG